jgi:hypothetical protein
MTYVLERRWERGDDRLPGNLDAVGAVLTESPATRCMGYGIV